VKEFLLGVKNFRGRDRQFIAAALGGDRERVRRGKETLNKYECWWRGGKEFMW